ncbi:MAG: AMP-binding protein, partial [Desulfomonile sp.]|nr:AMP-binding protein [Desulfomonile sp.]
MSDKLILRELSRYQLGTFADIIYRNAILSPDNDAFVCGAERISFRRFNERVNSVVHGLQDLGLQKGDIIGIVSWNCLEYPETFGAAMKGGYVIAPYSPRLNAEELVTVINDSEPRVLFLGPDLAETVNLIRGRLSNTKHFVIFGESRCDTISYNEVLHSYSSEEPEPVVAEDDPLVIFYTSGTTGTPRGA